MKKVAIVLIAALFLGACHCNCTHKKCSTSGRKSAASQNAKAGKDSAKKQTRAEKRAARKAAKEQEAAAKAARKSAVSAQSQQAPVQAAAVQDKDFAALGSINRTTSGRATLTFKQPITFKHDSDEIDASSLEQIRQTAQALKKYPNNTVRVAGYTDSLGNPNYNVDLSQRRAKSVAMELVKQGVSAENVSFIGYGAASPVASNKTREGRAQNRRVELEIANQ